MSRLISTRDLHNVVMKRKTEYGKLATLVDNIVEEMVKETHTADVVEREKIDKAIKEMKLEYYNLDSCENRLIASYWIEKSIKILKRNIGE